MEYRSLKNDFYYDSADDVLEYSLFNGAGEMIFLGKSFANPSGINRINICQKIKDWLNLVLPQGWDTVDAVYKHPEAYTDFTLYDHTTQQPLEVYYILYDWSTDFDGSDMVLSNPVNSKLDPRMRLFWTRFGLSSDTINIEKGYPHFVFEFTGSTDFDFSAQTRSYPFTSTDNTAFTMSTEEDWIRVYKYSNSFALDIAENSGSTTREGSFCIEYLDQNFNVVFQCFEVKQDREHLEIEFSGDTVFDYYKGTKDIAFTANTEIEVVSLPYWITGATVNGTTAGTITLSSATNSGNNMRTGAIEVRRKNASFGETASLNVSQGYPYFIVLDPSQTAITADYTQGAYTINVDTNIHTIYVETGVDWALGGYWNNAVGINIQANPNSSARTAVASVYGDYTSSTLVNIAITQVGSAYQGMYFTTRALSDGEISFGTTYSTDNKTVSYRINDGQWQTGQTLGKITLALTSGDTVQWRSNNNKLYGNRFYSTCNFDVYGNALSLIYGDSFPGKTTIPFDGETFKELFYRCTGLTDAGSLVLPSMTLSEYCYQQMFYDCSNLKTAPSLPATGLSRYCYSSMFANCGSLTTPPEELPATNLPDYCYEYMFANVYGQSVPIVATPRIKAITAGTESCYAMFSGCTSLTAVTEFAPEVFTGNDTCFRMFNGCVALVTAPATLPATALTMRCYEYMFRNCSALETAPDLLFDEQAPGGSAAFMFQNCSSLKYVKCLATKPVGGIQIGDWLYGVSQTGTFVKKAGAPWSSGSSGIPNGWTVQEV